MSLRFLSFSVEGVPSLSSSFTRLLLSSDICPASSPRPQPIDPNVALLSPVKVFLPCHTRLGTSALCRPEQPLVFYSPHSPAPVDLWPVGSHPPSPVSDCVVSHTFGEAVGHPPAYLSLSYFHPLVPATPTRPVSSPSSPSIGLHPTTVTLVALPCQ